MSLLKSSLLVLVAASLVCISGMSAEAQNRNTHRTNQGMSGGMGTSPTQSSIQSAQNQARSIANRQHQIWLANRLKKNAAERAAKANGTDTKTVKSTDSAKSTATETTTKSTSTTSTTAKPTTK
jgi:hypothetical protein